MLRSLWMVLGSLALALSMVAAAPGISAQFIGGTFPGMAAKSQVRIDFTGTEALLFRCGQTELTIEYRKINTLEYGQSVSRRYAAAILISPILLLSKARKHYVTLGYTDAEGKQQALVFRLGKGDVRSVLAGLQARTGRRIEYQDDEARKAGKG